MKILILSTYPIEPLMHGGQHRLANILEAYRQAGHEVQLAGVASSPIYAESEDFVDYPGENNLPTDLHTSRLTEECALGELFVDNPDFFNKLKSKFKFSPDLIHVEQPWLFSFAQKYIRNYCNNQTKLIYGAQNIEHLMKFESAKVALDLTNARIVRDKILQCELNAVKHADLVCCVSTHDQEWLEQVRSKNCILAANGVRPRELTTKGLIAANRISNGQKFALYCGSAHPPNIKGFFDVFGDGIGCLAPDEKLIIAGSAGIDIQNDKRFLAAPNLRNRCIIAQIVPEECLQGLLATAHLIILPITDGGGTNLKTAEAIWAGRHIVATPMSMRGFEQFSNHRGINVAPSLNDFQHMMRNSMAQSPLDLSSSELELRESVLWKNTLRNLMSDINSIR